MTETRTQLSVTSEIILGLAITEGWAIEALLPQRYHPGSPDQCVKELTKAYEARLRQGGYL